MREQRKVTRTSPPAAGGGPGWALAPLRLFLGITFVYAGLQKLADPQYFNPAANGFIGKQIASFASDSPIQWFLTNIAQPHAYLFGMLVAWGELAIGLGTLVGFLFRPAAFCGGLLSLIFFLSASWAVRPYFYGADIVFVFGWLTLYLAGAAGTGLPALDTWLWPWWRGELDAPQRPVKRTPVLSGARQGPTRREVLGSVTAGILGALAVLVIRERVSGQADDSLASGPRAAQTGQAIAAAPPATAVPTATSQPTALPAPVQPQPGSNALAVAPTATTIAPTQPPSAAPAANTQPTATSPQAAGLVIAQTSAVPANSALSFHVPGSYQDGVLVHLTGGQFVAFDAACTHAGCPVSYDPSSRLLRCPCHGAAFDPASAGAAVQRPARRPLASLPIVVDQASGTIRLPQ
jgi:thiosulfate dehydrogenase [quinone] large subunit